jgi:3-(methylsulfanyl)propanoyl-CoA dehydrogenase
MLRRGLKIKAEHFCQSLLGIAHISGTDLALVISLGRLSQFEEERHERLNNRRMTANRFISDLSAGGFKLSNLTPFTVFLASSASPQREKAVPGWGGRIRTSAWRNQNPLPYHLATPQSAPGKAAAPAAGRADHSGGALPDQLGRRAAHHIATAAAQRTAIDRRPSRCIACRMTSYRAPIADIAFALKHAAGLKAALAEGLFGDLDEETVDSVLEEAGKFAGEVIAPLNTVGDKFGTPFKDGAITTPPGWKEAYTSWAAAGWNGLAGPAAFGGQDLPHAVNAACTEMWNSACMAFGLAPLLTMAAVDALAAFGSDDLKQRYLAKLISGEWMGTMQLTEPQAGSDVGALRTRAVRAEDGSYRITGSKIFITYGEHDLTDNIIHFVLARLPDAPAGTKGISLFLIPKFLPDGTRNDLRAHSIEHKLGIHASPTCTMIYGDQGGAVGYLIGAENQGMHCMFTMMNRARLAVGLQGVAIAERATQQAMQYARERKQGAGGVIIHYPDVKRMLLTMRSLTGAARSLCYATAVTLDRSHRAGDAAARQAAHERASLLTPIAKAFSSDAGIEVASLGVQVHGGMGFIEETGAAQYYRDARIAAIYEGTNGIQAIDLVTRKIPLQGGRTVALYLDELRATVKGVLAANDPAFGNTGARLAELVDAVERVTQWLQAQNSSDAALAGATPYLRMFGSAAGGCMLAEQALAALRGGADGAGRTALARFFAENLGVQAAGLERSVTEGADSVNRAEAALAE